MSATSKAYLHSPRALNTDAPLTPCRCPDEEWYESGLQQRRAVQQNKGTRVGSTQYSDLIWGHQRVTELDHPLNRWLALPVLLHLMLLMCAHGIV